MVSVPSWQRESSRPKRSLSREGTDTIYPHYTFEILQFRLPAAACSAVRVGGVHRVQQRALRADSFGDRFEEPAVLFKCGSIASNQRLPHIVLNFRCDEFHPPYKNTRSFSRPGLDVEREYGVDVLLRNDVEQSRALLEPRVTPGLNH